MKLEDINLPEISESIREFMISASDMSKEMGPLIARQEKLYEDYRTAIGMGDLSENASYSDAIEDLQKIGVEMKLVSDRVNKLKYALSLTYIPNSSEDAFIQPLCTFVLIPIVDGKECTDDCMVYKVVPNVSMTNDHVLSTKSEIYMNELVNKRTGDIISVTHRITGEKHYYKIGEIY